MNTPSELFEKNRSWADKTADKYPDLFTTLSEGQTPGYLWIGCSDSRVSPTLLTDSLPGDLFVHRNVANQVMHSDLNIQSVLQYSVEVLKVPHIVVCGHYGCGGVTAALQDDHLGLIDNWLSPIRDIYERHRREVDEITDERDQLDRMCELNVAAQVLSVARSPFVQKAWEQNQELSVHGLIYRLETGRLKDLNLSAGNKKEMEELI